MTRKAQESQPMLPVDLLVAGHPCLVVGGGKVALRKVRSLLAAGATVTVVDPQASPEAIELAAAGQVVLQQRPFRSRDVIGVFLVFAATNVVAVNRQVLTAARRHRALCCCIDSSWTDGDFVSPAVIQQDAVTLAISTGGASSRRSRVMKENLARHLHFLGAADLLLVPGLKLPRPSERQAVTRLLSQLWPVQEFLLLPTRAGWDLLAVVADVRAVLTILKGVVRQAASRPALASQIGPAALGRVWQARHRNAPGYTADEIRMSVEEPGGASVGLILREWLDAATAPGAEPPGDRAIQARYELLLRSVPAHAGRATRDTRPTGD